MEAYIKIFLETKTPNTMFKNVLIRTDAFYAYGPGPSPHGCANKYCGIPQYLPFSIPRDFCLENNIIGRIYQVEDDEDDENYKILIETDVWSKGFAKELFEIKREDGYILRIISDIGDQNDESESLTFTLHHKDCPPKEFVPNWAAFPLPQDQLGFDYVDILVTLQLTVNKFDFAVLLSDFGCFLASLLLQDTNDLVGELTPTSAAILDSQRNVSAIF
uniref:Uncharacterized protein n=1 Tax=Acrobeloides nanus TaxID=290746 RepID=A0A914DWS8_9BILA